MSINIKKNYIYNLAVQVISCITPLITAPYLARTLGVTAIGNYSFVSSVAIYFSVFGALGTFTIGQRTIAYCQNNFERRTEVFFDIFILRFLLSIFITLIYTLFIMFNKLPVLFYTQIIFLINIAFDISWFFIGVEQFSIIVVRQSIAKICTIVFIIFFIKSPESIILYAIFPHVICFISYISYIPNLLKMINFKIKYKCNPFKYFIDSFLLFIPYLATTINSYFDRIMLGIYDVSKNQNAYYEEGYKIISILILIVTTLGNTLMPRIGALYKSNKVDDINKYMIISYKYTIMIALPMTFGILSISSNFIPWFLGTDYLQTIPVMQILSLMIILTGISYLTGYQYFIGTEKQNIYVAIVSIAAVINVILNILLIPNYNAIGASIATVISESIAVIIGIVLISKVINIFKLFKSITNYLIATFVMFICTFMLSIILLPSIFNTILIIIIGFIIYILLLILLNDILLNDILRTIKIKINKNNL